MKSNETVKNIYLTEGTMLRERYIIKQVLGSGGFGITYEAYDLLINRSVAVKEFYVEGCMKRDDKLTKNAVIIDEESHRLKVEKSLSNFRYEINIMKALQNVPYVSRIRDSFEENETVYIVMDLLHGRTLSEYSRKNIAINSTEIMEAVEHVLIALEEIHALGFIHRDISPGNLFLTDDGDLYLIDFGTATSTDTNSEYRNEQTFRHNGFHAPEYNVSDRQGPWTDIYSLCATLVYLITGDAVPDSADERARDAVSGWLVKSRLSASAQNAILRGLVADENKRLQNARELRIALCGALEEQPEQHIVKYAASTDIGNRKLNQDNMMVDGLFSYEGEDFVKAGELECKRDELHLVSVCDGVGGASCGELASKAASQALTHFLEQYRYSDIIPERLMDELLDQINEKIVTLGRKIGRTGTTMSFLLWRGNQYYAVNIGDSPIFMLRKHKLEQLSTAHTLAAARIVAGLSVVPKDIHTLVNYLGKEKIAGSQMASIRHGYIHKGDTFLLCSDGVTDKIDKDRLKRYLSHNAEGAIRSVRRTLARNSNNDNCSAIVIKF